MSIAAIEGLVAEGAAQPDRGGKHDWVKVERRDSAEVVCAAVIGRLQTRPFWSQVCPSSVADRCPSPRPPGWCHRSG